MKNISKFNELREQEIKEYLEEYRDFFEKHKHLSLERIAKELNRANIKNKGGRKWYGHTVARALDILNIPRVRVSKEVK